MVLDTSALLAIMLDEPERAQFADAIERDPVRLIGAPSLLETAIVLAAKKGEPALRELGLAVVEMQARIVPFGRDEEREARRAFLEYGKGRHAAGLNFGDCFAYALAVTTGEPLLFKGDDFARTDVTPVR
jgi:ribonuclease VapC